MAKNNLNISLGVDVSNLKKGFDEAIKITQQAAGKTEQEMKEMADAIVRQLGKIGSQSTMRGAIRQMENLAGTMSRFGMEGTAAFNEVIKQTGKLKAEQQDLKDLIDASRPDAPFKAMANALQSGAQAFAGVQGAMQLFGAESEDTQKILVKLQAALAFAEGTKAIDGFADSFKQLNLVIKQNPILAAVAAVSALVAVFSEINSFINHTTDSYEALTQVQNKAYANTVKERTELEYYRDRLNDANTSQEERKQLLNDIAKQYPEYLGQLNKEGLTQVQINSALDGYIKLITLKAQAQAAQELYTENLKKEFELQRDLIKAMGEAAQAQMTGNSVLSATMEGRVMYMKQQQKNAEIDSKYYKDLYQNLNKAASAATKLQTATFGTSTVSGSSKISVKERTPVSFDTKMQGIGTTNLINPNALKRQQEIQMPEPRSIPVERVAELNAELAKVQITTEEVNASFQNLAMSGLTDIATAMGTAIATGQNLGQAIGQGLLRAMAGFMKQLGEMFIKAGLAKLAFDSAMISIGGAPLAIAAGTALVAASAAMTAKLQQANQPARFAEGGLVPAGFSGDSFPALMSSGEAAIPLHNPRAMAKLRDGLQINSGIRIYGKFDGRDIYLANEKYSKDRRR